MKRKKHKVFTQLIFINKIDEFIIGHHICYQIHNRPQYPLHERKGGQLAFYVFQSWKSFFFTLVKNWNKVGRSVRN